MTTLLTDEQITVFLDTHNLWTRHGNEIRRTFEFKNFNESMGFVLRVGLKAERLNHHPDIDIRWNKVSLGISTHSEGGLTELDTELAAFCDEIA